MSRLCRDFIIAEARAALLAMAEKAKAIKQSLSGTVKVTMSGGGGDRKEDEEGLVEPELAMVARLKVSEGFTRSDGSMCLSSTALLQEAEARARAAEAKVRAMEAKGKDMRPRARSPARRSGSRTPPRRSRSRAPALRTR